MGYRGCVLVLVGGRLVVRLLLGYWGCCSEFIVWFVVVLWLIVLFTPLDLHLLVFNVGWGLLARLCLRVLVCMLFVVVVRVGG